VRAVWFVGAMGLLDDAIREHLELKRLRGADPGEVAREQREALDPVPREEHGAGEHSADVGNVASEAGFRPPAGNAIFEGAGEMARMDGAPGEDAPSKASQVTPGQGFSNVGQETAELDMRTVLEADQGLADRKASPAGPVVVGLVVGVSGERYEEDSLEWEVPREAASEPSPDGDGPDEPAGGHEDAEDETEDVLEETPDFLRDTPEQERLWFEQRPPRDFDFDK
jgi:hypothetical protein